MTYIHDYKTSDGIAKVIYRSKHLNMRDIHNHGPPPITTGTTTQLVYDDAYSQIPPYDDWIQ